jgi:guanosine-3',5'-bis(diphosphate) 3'-pyrophosphohydrolase
MSEYHQLLDAIAFAARAHAGQLRKDGRTPYVSHVFRVCTIVRNIFGFDDPRMLTAAVLHDTIEDTTTDFDDLKEKFGREIAEWVALLSKDKRSPDRAREEDYMAALCKAPWQVHVCKLADVYDNLLDSTNLPTERRGQSIQRARAYVAALESVVSAETRRPLELVKSRLPTV